MSKSKKPFKDEILSVAEAADVLGTTVRALKHHISLGHLPAKKVGRDWALLRSDVEGFESAPRGRPKVGGEL